MRHFRSRSTGPRESLRLAPQPWVPRLARSYQGLSRGPIDHSMYPATNIGSVVPSIHDIPLTQGIFANDFNFSQSTSCEVFETGVGDSGNGIGSWKTIAGDTGMEEFVQSMQQAGQRSLRFCVVFCNLKYAENTSFGLQISITRKDILKLLDSLRVCPQFCRPMLGEPDYWSPLVVHSRNTDGSIGRTELVCQHPRYTIHTRQQPCSVYMAYDVVRASTLYIVVSGEGESWVERAKSRMDDYYHRSKFNPTLVSAEAVDPFLLQSILCHESLVEAKVPITDLRHRLYDVLDVVGEYSEEPFHRKNLKDMTQKLHQVSQDADSLSASAEMGTMVVEHSRRSRAALLENITPRPAFGTSNVGDALEYLSESLDSQKRWLQSYKSRKDIAMNLVFNLVTQQDSETSTDIARDTKDDSASMKIIAVLTMVFLPATAVSGFFGMAFFNLSDEGVFLSSKMAWLFVATTMPLTLGTFTIWTFWYKLVNLLQHWKRGREAPVRDPNP